MDFGKDEESWLQFLGLFIRRKFVILLEEEEVFCVGVKFLFRLLWNFIILVILVYMVFQMYVEYVITQPLGGAGVIVFIGFEFVVGENFSQILKIGVKFNSIIVSLRQRGNFVLKFVCNVFWEFGEVIFDYVLGQSICVFFFSFCYYNFYLDYIYEWLQSLGKNFVFCVLLV